MYGWLGKVYQTIITRDKRFLQPPNMEDTINADYAHAKRVSKDFGLQNLWEYHGLYVQSDTYC